MLIIFIGLLIAGLIKEDLSWGNVFFCCFLVAVSLAAFIHFHWSPYFFTAELGLINIVLVFVILKGDIQI